MGKYIQVSTTVEKKEDAERIARTLVETRMAACVQVIGPIRSTYWWKGKVEEAGEWLCMMKTREELYPDLEASLRALHPYEVPEIVAVPVVEGSEPYLRWIDEETKTEQAQGTRPKAQGKADFSRQETE
jgi:periplasmic divalent cation tolerance protein